MRHLRLATGLTMREFAILMGVTVGYLGHMEQGRREYLPKWKQKAYKIRDGALSLWDR